jgi:hypothetical protein
VLIQAVLDTAGLTPAPAAGGLNELLTGLEQVLVRTNINTLELAANAGPTLSVLTGVPAANLTDYHRTEVADRLHAYRNLALATAALAASTIEVTSTATAPSAIYTHAIQLRRRSIQLRRPLADDEIVLCRVAAYLASRVDPCDHAASIGSLLVAGLAPCETTQVRIDDFDNPAAPTILLAAGNAQLEARYIELDKFASHILGRHMQQALRAGRSPETPLTYRPRNRKQGPEASAGLHRRDRLSARSHRPVHRAARVANRRHHRHQSHAVALRHRPGDRGHPGCPRCEWPAQRRVHVPRARSIRREAGCRARR